MATRYGRAMTGSIHRAADVLAEIPFQLAPIKAGGRRNLARADRFVDVFPNEPKGSRCPGVQDGQKVRAQAGDDALGRNQNWFVWGAPTVHQLAEQFGAAAAVGVNSGRDNIVDNNLIIDATAPNAGYYGSGNDMYHWGKRPAIELNKHPNI